MNRENYRSPYSSFRIGIRSCFELVVLILPLAGLWAIVIHQSNFLFRVLSKIATFRFSENDSSAAIRYSIIVFPTVVGFSHTATPIFLQDFQFCAFLTVGWKKMDRNASESTIRLECPSGHRVRSPDRTNRLRHVATIQFWKFLAGEIRCKGSSVLWHLTTKNKSFWAIFKKVLLSESKPSIYLHVWLQLMPSASLHPARFRIQARDYLACSKSLHGILYLSLCLAGVRQRPQMKDYNTQIHFCFL